MLNEEEMSFFQFWSKVRLEYGTTASKLKRGMPGAILFSFSIFISLGLVFFLSPAWYTKISQRAGGATMAILLAVMLTAFFFSYFRMHYQWEMNEQYFKELKNKLQKNETSKTNNTNNEP
jgi:hypothetical protein